MVIEKVHGLRATSMSLNDRFTLLATVTPDRALGVRRRRPSTGSIRNQNVNLNFKNRLLMEQIARHLEQQAQRQTVRQRIGLPGGLRRFGSESSLPGLVRANSFGNLNSGIKNRISWRQSNGNLSRSASFGNLSASVWRGRSLRGFRRRGGGQRAVRGRFRGRVNSGRVTRVSARGVAYKRPVRQAAARGNARGARGNMRGGARGNTRGGARGNMRGGARGNMRGARGATRGAARGRGRGQGTSRPQTPKPVPTKEELDAQLDQYMASSKSALDKELDEYMKNAMDLE